MDQTISPEVFYKLSQIDSCSLANAIETFDIRLRNEGFNDAGVDCRSPGLPPMLGYATTLRIRASSPPPRGHVYLDRSDWWSHLESVPVPHIVVIEDIDEHPGSGAFLGEVHTSILKALGCVGAVTNGAVRDLPAVRKMGFPLFSGSLSVSHAYVHVVDFGMPVTIGGLEIRQGDLLHGDEHGILRVPLEIAAEIPAAVAKLREREAKITAFCRSKEFTLAGLRRLLGGIGEGE